MEALTKSLRALEELVDAAHDAALLLSEERLGGEVGDAVGEAALDEVGVHLLSSKKYVSLDQDARGCSRLCASKTYVHEVLHLLALHTALQLALLGGVQPVAQSWSATRYYFGRRAQCAACLPCRQTTMRSVSDLRRDPRVRV